jgi:hypothetical protein
VSATDQGPDRHSPFSPCAQWEEREDEEREGKKREEKGARELRGRAEKRWERWLCGWEEAGSMMIMGWMEKAMAGQKARAWLAME